VLRISGDIQCTTSWQKGLYFLVAMLALVPFCLALWLRHATTSTKSHDGIASFVAPYRVRWVVWPAWLLIERLVIYMIDSFSDPANRSWNLALILSIVALLHGAIRPHGRLFVALYDSALLGILVLLGCWGVVVFDSIQLGDPITGTEQRAVAVASLALLPLIFWLVIALCSITAPKVRFMRRIVERLTDMVCEERGGVSQRQGATKCTVLSRQTSAVVSDRATNEGPEVNEKKESVECLSWEEGTASSAGTAPAHPTNGDVGTTGNGTGHDTVQLAWEEEPEATKSLNLAQLGAWMLGMSGDAETNHIGNGVRERPLDAERENGEAPLDSWAFC